MCKLASDWLDTEDAAACILRTKLGSFVIYFWLLTKKSDSLRSNLLISLLISRCMAQYKSCRAKLVSAITVLQILYCIDLYLWYPFSGHTLGSRGPLAGPQLDSTHSYGCNRPYICSWPGATRALDQWAQELGCSVKFPIPIKWALVHSLAPAVHRDKCKGAV